MNPKEGGGSVQGPARGTSQSGTGPMVVQPGVTDISCSYHMANTCDTLMSVRGGAHALRCLQAGVWPPEGQTPELAMPSAGPSAGPSVGPSALCLPWLWGSYGSC